MNPSTTDRIERSIVIRASRKRVWRALTDAAEFGAWFGVRVTGKFAPGARLGGAITSPGYEHVKLDLTVERMEPEHTLSWRWHPHAVEPGVDYSKEPTTLVVFELVEVPEGTRVDVVESGFDQISPARRALAYRMNGDGWSSQLQNLARHVA